MTQEEKDFLQRVLLHESCYSDEGFLLKIKRKPMNDKDFENLHRAIEILKTITK